MADTVGIDIVETGRIKRVLERYGERFSNRILGTAEKVVFSQRRDRAGYLAGRFAAKEATIKALGKYLKRRPPLSDIQIINDPGGQPRICFPDDLSGQLKGVEFLVSISHDGNYATAITIGTLK